MSSPDQSIDVTTVQGKRQVLANLRHELRTPLNAIIGYSEMLLEDAEDAGGDAAPEYLPQLQKVLQCGRQLLTKVNEVLDTGHLENACDIDLAAYAARIYSELREPLQNCLAHCELLVEAAEQSAETDALDELTKIQRAAQKLAGLIEDGLLLLKATSGKNAGDALSLARQSESTPAHHHSTHLENARVLVVDDNETNRDLLLRRLQRQGCEVILAVNGEDALSKIAQEPPDLILLDIMMPGLNGYEVLSRLKAHADWRHIPVLMISALDETDSVVRCIEMGAEDYLPKPFNPILLHARVHACLEKKRLRDQEVRLFHQLEDNYRKLQELEQLRDSLTDMVVHDLRTPLTSIISGLQTLEAIAEFDELQSEVLEMALSGGQTLLRMINDLLDISKMEAGQLKLEYAKLDGQRMARACVQQVEMLARNRELHVVENIPSDLPPLIADEDKLTRTLTNLLGNAIKFTPQGGTIVLSAEPQKDAPHGIYFAVADTGEGIPKEAFVRIFEKFGQVENRREGRRMSTGLGLTFCKMVVEAHGGRIWVESEPGKGSNFQFVIPLQPPVAT